MQPFSFDEVFIPTELDAFHTIVYNLLKTVVYENQSVELLVFHYLKVICRIVSLGGINLLRINKQGFRNIFACVYGTFVRQDPIMQRLCKRDVWSVQLHHSAIGEKLRACFV